MDESGREEKGAELGLQARGGGGREGCGSELDLLVDPFKICERLFEESQLPPRAASALGD